MLSRYKAKTIKICWNIAQIILEIHDNEAKYIMVIDLKITYVGLNLASLCSPVCIVYISPGRKRLRPVQSAADVEATREIQWRVMCFCIAKVRELWFCIT